MPNKIEDNVRQRALDAVVSRLKEIDLTGGYNTQPLVTTSFMEADEADSQFALWVFIGDEEMDEASLLAGAFMRLEIVVQGFITQGDDDLQRDANKLLQDTRTALDTYRTEFRAATGTGGFHGFGLCETDSGILSKQKRALFSQPLEFTYSQGETW